MKYNSVTEKHLNSIDWSFPSFSNTGIHSIHWYPATFISAIPGTLIPILSNPGEVVIDPFCGSGTTGVETLRLGRNFIGIDNNPISILITEAKLYHPASKVLKEELERIVLAAQAISSIGEVETHPQFSQLRDWYHPETLARLDALMISISKTKNKHIRKCLLAIFSGILKNACSQGKHWGWVCDNVKPKPFEITYKDPIAIFIDACEYYIKSAASSYELAKSHSGIASRAAIRKNYSLYNDDCIKALEKIPIESVDLVMTSPPYYGVADYVKSQRLSYLWFDRDLFKNEQLGFRHFEMLRKRESGSRSYRARKNSHQLYIKFLETLFSACYRVLKKGSCIAFVVGESKSRQQTTEDLICCAEENGFVISYRKRRDIRHNKRRLMAKVQGEDVLVFTKPI